MAITLKLNQILDIVSNDTVTFSNITEATNIWDSVKADVVESVQPYIQCALIDAYERVVK